MRLMKLVNYIFVHQDTRYAQNHELRIEVNVLIIRATSCTLRCDWDHGFGFFVLTILCSFA